MLMPAMRVTVVHLLVGRVAQANHFDIEVSNSKFETRLWRGLDNFQTFFHKKE
jgi:hypothetical protein